uniref:Uncharacterized protein n=1 Tax=Anguilla anguilla TaxID=7936 RepID=A0A0E9S2N4_ANGAN
MSSHVPNSKNTDIHKTGQKT